jgi:predicted dehydrogenase
MSLIKVGIIGTGFSAKSHIEALRRLSGVEVVAISGSTLEKAKQAAKQFSIPNFYESVDELIDDPEVEVVHNCTPNYLHYTVNKKVLEKGKHLLSEKPLAMTSEESRELLELAKSKNVVAGVCFNYRHYPLVAQAKELIAKGEYGPVHFVHGTYLQDWLLYDTDYNWRLDTKRNGRSRAIADIGSHWCDTVQYVLNKKIVEVFADLKTVHPVRKKPIGEVETFQSKGEEAFEEIQIDSEDCGSVIVHFEDGTHGAFVVSQVNAGRKNYLTFEIAAKRGTLHWNQEEPNKLWIGRRDEANMELTRDPSLLSSVAAALAHYPGGHQEGWPDGLKNLFIDFYTVVKTYPNASASSFATIEDGHRIMQLIEAIVKSNEEKRWVEVETGQEVLQ